MGSANSQAPASTAASPGPQRTQRLAASQEPRWVIRFPSMSALFLPVSLILGAGLLVLAALVAYFVRAQDRQAIEASKVITEASLQVENREIAYDLDSYAWWDEAVSQVEGKLDPKWLDDNFGSYQAKSHAVSASFVIGSHRLLNFLDDNAMIEMRPVDYTNNTAIIRQFEHMVAVNSAIEVDLTGQVNAEQSGSQYLGGTGGQVDFVRAGSRSPGGHSIIALPATAKGGAISRIAVALSGPVTTTRSDVDVIVTEFGAAELKGQTLAERARRLVAIAHPDFREELDKAADAIRRRGF